MRLNIFINNQAAKRSGYINLDGGLTEEKDGVLPCKPGKLNDIVCDNEADEIVAIDVLDAYPGSEIDAVLQHWLSKLAHGAKITIGLIDFKKVALGFAEGKISGEDMVALIYGTKYVRRSTVTMSQLATVLENRGLKVISKKLENNRIIITAERP